MQHSTYNTQRRNEVGQHACAQMSLEEQHLRRAIRLAVNGRGLVEPNPMVGCVIVKHDRVIGEGYHEKYGQPHAEPNALASCSESPEGATAYVTLEPCCHTNKQTPPCVPRLIAAKIARVVIGCLDPNPEVNGNGVRQLRQAGIVVDGPMLEAECKQLIAPFIKSNALNWPYATLKWAQSTDKRVAGAGGIRVQISNPTSSRQIQLLRSRSDFICVGINTVLNDNPNLMPHGVPSLRSVERLVLDSDLRIPLSCNLVKTAKDNPTELFCFPREYNSPKAEQLRKLGLQITHLDPTKWTEELPGRRLSLSEMLVHIGKTHLLVEPGPTLAQEFFEQNTADRLWVIRSPKTIGDDTAPSAAAIPDYFVQTGEVNLDGDVLCEYLNTTSKVFFAAVPSADFCSIGVSPMSSRR
jgi:diaminohydroxyphosphoribosylaminopyrimidine deaminase/5-amino-6-(5-phosphoribosylamino)uracil reductase